MVLRQRAKTIGVIAISLACIGLLWIAWSAPSPSPDQVDPDQAEVDAPDPFEDAALTGVVRDPEGEAVVGATVMVRRAGVPSTAHTTRTDSAGRYGFIDLPAGKWRLDAAAKGLLSPGPEQVRAIAIETDDETSLEVNLTLRREARVSGRVIAGDKGLSNVPIDVHYQASVGVAGKLAPYLSRRVGATDVEGRFSLAVAPGRFVLVVRDRSLGERKTDAINLADGAQRSGLRIDFSPGGRVEGKVQTSAGQVVRATLVLSGAGLAQPRRTNADARGHFTLKGVPSGSYTLAASAPGFQDATTQLSVRPDAVTTHDFLLIEMRGLTGRVIDDADKPVPRARVVLNWGAAEVTVYCDDAGSFRWRRDGVPAQTVRAMAFSRNHSPSAWVSAGSEGILTLRVSKGGFITGRVVGPDGDGVFPAAVAVASMDVASPNPFKPSDLTSTRIGNREGTFRLGPLPPGRYSLRGESQKHSPGLVADILVSADHTTANIEIRLTRGGAIRGVVRDDANAPIPGARVTLWLPNAVMPPRIARADAEGMYAITGLPKGRFSLRVQQQGYLTSLSSGVELAEGEDVDRDLVLRKAKKGERFAFQGIGATLTRKGGGIAVGNLIANSPAMAAGLQSGDVITAVDGQGTQKKGLREVVEWIRGEPDSTVTLAVVRGGKPMNIEIRRGNVVMK